MAALWCRVAAVRAWRSGEDTVPGGCVGQLGQVLRVHRIDAASSPTVGKAGATRMFRGGGGRGTCGRYSWKVLAGGTSG
eukprot:6204589-Pleurochrysis_carterae.AAC.2